MFTVCNTLIWAVLTGPTDWVCHIWTLTLCVEAVAWSCIIVTRWSGSGGIQAWSLTTNWFSSVLWHCWFGHLACKNRLRNDLLCVEWDVKAYTLTHSPNARHYCCRLYDSVPGCAVRLIGMYQYVAWAEYSIYTGLFAQSQNYIIHRIHRHTGQSWLYTTKKTAINRTSPGSGTSVWGPVWGHVFWLLDQAWIPPEPLHHVTIIQLQATASTHSVRVQMWPTQSVQTVQIIILNNIKHSVGITTGLLLEPYYASLWFWCLESN